MGFKPTLLCQLKDFVLTIPTSFCMLSLFHQSFHQYIGYFRISFKKKFAWCQSTLQLLSDFSVCFIAKFIEKIIYSSCLHFFPSLASPLCSLHLCSLLSLLTLIRPSYIRHHLAKSNSSLPWSFCNSQEYLTQLISLPFFPWLWNSN